MTTIPPNPLPPDVDKGPLFLILTCILTVLSFTATFLRCWVRRAHRQLGWDDYLMVPTTLFTLVRTGIQIASVFHGNGRHVWYLSDEDTIWVVMAGWYTQLILFPSICLLKMSIALLLLRIKDTPRTKVAMWIMMAGLIATNLLPVIILLAECSPVQAYWNLSTGKCWNPKIRIYSIYLQVAYSILTDLICSFLPIVVLYSVRIPLRDKFLVCGLMSLGLIATTCAAIRASSLGIATSDLTYDYCIAAIWANTELHMAIIGANAACGRSIYKHFRYGLNPPDDSQVLSNPPYPSRTGYFRTSEPSLNLTGQAKAQTTSTITSTKEDIEFDNYPHTIKKQTEFIFLESRIESQEEPSRRAKDDEAS
ncbi:hypothetical protein G7Y89_g5695 [Cudoniella acicularis]|uniref:Rhodopsin domain-containing protein n=1 Tax=Cudoniella acicularis TaxID=354080 RepID=A0A8H4W5H4_9HELO|nr:hypothetical protein G7Y89_g5695 [Cudoniella acicularis]